MVNSDTFSGVITEAMVYAAISEVLDPELDESLVKLGFIDRIEIVERDVTIAFKLPTYWCSPNFAYLMAADLRTSVQAMPGVRSARVLLLDHCSEEEVSAGVNAGKSFVQAFPDEAEDNLEELRLIFLRKGFLVRQDALLRQLQKLGLAEEVIFSLQVADLRVEETSSAAMITTADKTIRLERMAKAAQAYLRRAALLKVHTRPEDLLFVDEKGNAIAPGSLQIYLRQSRAVRMNIMFNTVFCTDMFQTRYGPGPDRIVPEGERV